MGTPRRVCDRARAAHATLLRQRCAHAHIIVRSTDVHADVTSQVCRQHHLASLFTAARRAAATTAPVVYVLAAARQKRVAARSQTGFLFSPALTAVRASGPGSTSMDLLLAACDCCSSLLHSRLSREYARAHVVVSTLSPLLMGAGIPTCLRALGRWSSFGPRRLHRCPGQ